MSEPYERGGRVVIPDPYVSQFGTETPGGRWGEQGMDELRQSDLERDFPDWQFTHAVSGLPAARRRMTSPPVWLQGEDWTDLRDQVAAWVPHRFRS